MRIFWNFPLPGPITAIALLGLTLVNVAVAKEPPWQHAPGLADLGLTPSEAAVLAGTDILLLPHSLHDLEISDQHHAELFHQVRFVSGLLVLPVSAEVLQHELAQPQDASLGQGLRLHIEQRQTVAQDQYYEETQDYPLPWWHWRLHMRWHRHPLAAGQWLTELQQGDIRASLSRTEIYPLDSHHALWVYTLWSDLGSQSWIIRLLQQTQPELSRALPWLAVSTVMEAKRQSMSLPVLRSASTPPPQFIEGSVRIHPWSARPSLARSQPWISVDQSFPATPVSVMNQLGQFTRYPEFLHALKEVRSRQVGTLQHTDWDLGIRLGLLYVQRSYHLTLQTTPSEIIFQGQDDHGHNLQGQWTFHAGPELTTQSRLSLQMGEDRSWITGYLRYTPYPEIAAPMLGSLLILHRSHHWLSHTYPRPSIPASTKHTEWGP